MNKNKLIPYPSAIDLCRIAYMRDVKVWYTHNHPTLIDGLLMYDRSAPAYNMVEPMLDMIYIPAPTIKEAVNFLGKLSLNKEAFRLKQKLIISTD